MTAQWQKVVDHIMSFKIGTYEGYTNSGGYDNNTQFGRQYGENFVSWCVIFDWCVYSDMGLASIVPKTDNVSSFTSWAQARGQWSEYPSVGAWVNFNNGEHTEMVVGFDATYVYTKGGNTNNNGSAQGDGIYAHSNVRTSSKVTGYFAPKFPDGVCPPTADPADHRGGKKVASWRWSAPAAPAPAPKPAPKPVPLQPIVGRLVYAGNLSPTRPDNGSITILQRVLNVDLTLKLPETGKYDAATKAAVKKVQTNLHFSGSDADGYIGDSTLAFLAKKYKFTVVGKCLPAPAVKPTPAPAPKPGVWVTSVAIDNKTGVSFARYNGGGNMASWIAAACKARGITAPAAVANWTRGMSTIMSRESSGNANACNTNDLNNVTPSGFSQVRDYGDAYPASGSIYQLNGAYTNYQCSRGAVQCIPQTFAHYHCPGTSNMIYDPVASVAASMGYVGDVYGVADDGSDLAAKVQQADPNRSPRGY